MKIEIHDEIESSISGLLTRQGCLRQEDETNFLFVGLGEKDVIILNSRLVIAGYANHAEV